MQVKTKTLIATCLASLAIFSLAVASSAHLSDIGVSWRPIPVRQGPLGLSNAGTGDPYWFQQGAFADGSTYGSVGASVMIRTVFDRLNNDAHSYWVGSVLTNGAFVQVGYLNGLTTTGQYYCCAWFYEFFPPNNSTSPPIIGPAGSAGPIGSWHTYTMNSTAGGVWSFYMDNQYLGSSPPVGNQWNLGASHAENAPGSVAALSEVADATTRTDIIGPAEFKSLMYAPTNPNSFQPVSTGNTHIGCGLSPNSCLPNPYGVAEMERVPNDFLSGSLVPPGQDSCGNSAPDKSTLWSPLGPICTGSFTTFDFSFVDMDGGMVTPTWISLVDQSGTEIFYSNFPNQMLPNTSSYWTINQVYWHSINVATNAIVNSSVSSQVFLTNTFSVRVEVIGYFYSLPVKNATVIMYLPDTSNQTLKTDDNGEATFSQLPPSAYSFHISVPYGVTSNQNRNIAGPGSLVAKVFSLPELITIIIPPILLAIIASAAVARREHKRQAMMQSQQFPAPSAGPAHCRRCAAPLSPTANFCTSCGTPVRMMVQ